MVEFTAFGHEHLDPLKKWIPAVQGFLLAGTAKIVTPASDPGSFVLKRILDEVARIKPRLVGLEGAAPGLDWHGKSLTNVTHPLSRYYIKRHLWYDLHAGRNGVKAVYLEDAPAARALYTLHKFIPQPSEVNLNGTPADREAAFREFVIKRKDRLLRVPHSAAEDDAITTAYRTAGTLLSHLIATPQSGKELASKLLDSIEILLKIRSLEMNQLAIDLGVEATDTGASHAFDFNALRGGALKLALITDPLVIQLSQHNHFARTAAATVEKDPEIVRIILRGTGSRQTPESLGELLKLASEFKPKNVQLL